MLLAATLLVPLLLIRLLSVADLTSWSQLEDAMSSSDTLVLLFLSSRCRCCC